MSSSLPGHLNHRLPEYVAEVMSQWLDGEEILPFIKTIKDWQEKVALSDIRLPKFAQYSTGWSVDKVSLVLVPLVSSAGVVVSNISEPLSLLGSARKLAFYSLVNFNSHSNILQSIPGFQTSLEKISASKNANSWQDIRDSLLGCFISSILLGGVNGASFDMKVGEGSFLQSLQEARSLALSLKNACNRLKISASFILSDMNQPLGQAVGNSLEVREVLEVLKGKGPLDVLKLSLELGTEILLLAKKSSNRTEAKRDLKQKIIKGKALEKLREIIEAQKGNPRIIEDYSLLPQAKNRMKILSAKKGFIHKIMMKKISSLCLELESAGMKPTDSFDRGSGLLIFKKFGEKVEKGEALAEVHFSKLKNISRFEKESQGAFMISEKPPDFRPFIYERIVGTV
jgi:pyrimidine-nucleoside phosphorylase